MIFLINRIFDVFHDFYLKDLRIRRILLLGKSLTSQELEFNQNVVMLISVSTPTLSKVRDLTGMDMVIPSVFSRDSSTFWPTQSIPLTLKHL
jgi:hypothetical protein